MPAAIPGRVSIQVRIDETVWKKVKAIAKLESRNANAQLTHYVQKAVEAYEQEYGVVSITD